MYQYYIKEIVIIKNLQIGFCMIMPQTLLSRNNQQISTLKSFALDKRYPNRWKRWTFAILYITTFSIETCRLAELIAKFDLQMPLITQVLFQELKSQRLETIKFDDVRQKSDP